MPWAVSTEKRVGRQDTFPPASVEVLAVPAHARHVALPVLQAAPPPPPPPTGFTHGEQIHRYNIGVPDGYYAEDTRTAVALTSSGGLNITSGTHVFTRVKFTGRIIIGGTATVTFIECKFVGQAGTSFNSYLMHLTSSSTAKVECIDCTFICRNAFTKNILLNGHNGLKLRRCLILGGADTIHMSTSSSTIPWPTEQHCEDFTGLRLLLEDCYWSEIHHEGTDPHSDGFQCDGGSYVVVKRCRGLGFRLQPTGAWPQDGGATFNQTVLSSTALILTQNSASPKLIDRFGIYDSSFDGGNFTVQTNPTDGILPTRIFVRRNSFGQEFPAVTGYAATARFGPIALGSGTTKSGNYECNTGIRWKQGNSGTPEQFFSVTRGQPI